MNTKTLIISLAAFINCSYSQVKVNSSNVWSAKEFSKEISLFKAKEYLITSVLEPSTEVVTFEIEPLAAASSGELTTLIYKCDTQQKEGLILGFYGDYWSETGVLYQGYSFKNLDKPEATEFLIKIQQSIEAQIHFLRENPDNHNIFFIYDDLEVLIYVSMTGSYQIRIFWDGFDSTWEKTAFERTKKRFEKKSSN
jgi:hypothetical protein